MADISVIVATNKSEEEVECLDALDLDSENAEVIIRQDEGATTARNKGINNASADKLVFLDDDSIPLEGYLSVAADLLDSHSIVAGKIVPPSNNLVSTLCTNYDQGPEGKYTQTITGCNMAFRQEVFDAVGGFDENIHWGHEETELLDRARREFPAYYSPDLVVEHACADSVFDYWRKMYRFAPADDYYDDKRGVSTRMKLLKLFNPRRYFHPTVAGTVVKSVGAVLRGTHQVKCIAFGHPWDCDDSD